MFRSRYSPSSRQKDDLGVDGMWESRERLAVLSQREGRKGKVKLTVCVVLGGVVGRVAAVVVKCWSKEAQET